MTDDDWMVEAMSDGALVANVLVNLRRASLPEKKEDSRAPPLRWRVKQRRSRPMATSKATSTPSPTTPLSWSGATFPAADGLEDSSSPPDASAKSKGRDAIENTGCKRSRKKKTLAELKEDEVLFLKERRDLKKKLASLCATLEIERATNDRLKRLKLDYVSRSAKGVELPTHAEGSPKMEPSYNLVSADLEINASKTVQQFDLSNHAKSNEEVTNQENKFMLPDLNLPIEDLTT